MANLLIDWEKLQYSDPLMYRALSKVTGYTGLGFREVNTSDLEPAFAADVRYWETHVQKTVVLPRKPPAPQPVKEPGPLPPQIDMNEIIKEQRAKADEAAAKARLDWWAKEQGLENSQHNADVIVKWIRETLSGYFCAKNVDSTIAHLGPRGTNVLRWTTPQAAPAEPPAEPQEVLESWQLPINADERAMRKASTKALLDLNQRRRKLTNQQYVRKSASFGSKFI